MISLTVRMMTRHCSTCNDDDNMRMMTRHCIVALAMMMTMWGWWQDIVALAMMYLLPACSGRRMVAGDAGPPNPQCNDHHRDHWTIKEVSNIWLVIFGKTRSSNWLEAKILDSDWSMLDLPICNAMIIITIIGSSERSSIFGIFGSSERFSIFVRWLHY